jgi:hypothetical protein
MATTRYATALTDLPAEGGGFFFNGGKRVYWAVNESGSLYFRRSFDEGGSWAARTLIEATNAEIALDDPVAVDPVTGNIYVLGVTTGSSGSR